MNELTPRAKSLIDDMLKATADNLERRMRIMIIGQIDYYESSKRQTLGKLLGEVDSQFSLTSTFKYQEAIGSTLQEMQKSFLEYFGKPWDYVEPIVEEVVEEPVTIKRKRGRPKKA